MTKRQEKVEELKLYHHTLFESLGLNYEKVYFDSKIKRTAFPEVGKVGFFETQLDKGDDIYFEINDLKQNVIDPKRTIYVLRNDPDWRMNKTGKYVPAHIQIVGEQFFVQMKDFEIVVAPPKPDYKEQANTGLNLTELGDVHLSKLSGRDWACIHLRVPESNYGWLNDLIIQSNQLQYGNINKSGKRAEYVN